MKHFEVYNTDLKPSGMLVIVIREITTIRN